MMPRGKRRHTVLLENPSEPIPDGNGGYSQTWSALSPPRMPAHITTATARDLETVLVNVVNAQATSIVTLDYHPQITTKTRITFGTRILEVTGVKNDEERNRELTLTCIERVP